MGQQWPAMGRRLLEQSPVFREAVEECDRLFRKHTSRWSLLEELTAEEPDSRIHSTEIAQPAIFALQVGISRIWDSLGVVPDAIIGHSVGEVAAAYASGSLSLEDAVLVSFQRSRLQHRTEGKGKMLAVGIGPDEAAEYINAYPDTVSVAAINSRNSVTLAGETAALEDIAGQLEEVRIFNRLLKVAVPYHSPVMDEILDEFRDAVVSIRPRKSRIPLYSTVTGGLIDGTVVDGEYWCGNIRQPVLFSDSMKVLVDEGLDVFVEISAHPVLSMYMKEMLGEAGKPEYVFPSQTRKSGDVATLFSSFGALHCSGYPVDWSVLYPKWAKRLKLPAYPWQKSPYWNESPESQQIRTGTGVYGEKLHPLLGLRQKSSVPAWSMSLSLFDYPYLADHRVQGSILFPAAGFIEIGLAVSARLKQKLPVQLCDIEIKAPLMLSEDDDMLVQAVIRDGNRFSIAGRSPDAELAWTEHASGRMDIDSVPEKPKPVAVKQIIRTAASESNGEDCYRRFDDLGLQYGPAFRLLRRIWLTPDGAVGEVDCGFYRSGDLDDYRLHPAVLDSCLQVMASMPAEGTYLPVSVKSVTLFEKPPVVFYSIIRIRKKHNNFIKGDIALTDTSGNVFAKIDGVRCAFVEGTRKQSPGIYGENVYEYRWLRTRAIDGDGSYPLLPVPDRSAWKTALESGSVPGFDKKEYRSGFLPVTRKLFTRYILNAFAGMGFPLQPGGRSIPVADLMKNMKIKKKQERLFLYCLHHLQEKGYLKSGKNGWACVKELRSRDATKLFRSAVLEFSQYQAELTLFNYCAGNLGAVLQGKIDPENLIRSQTAHLLEHLSVDSPAVKSTYLALADLVVRTLNDLDEERPVRILEIGAGVGAFSTFLLPELPEYMVEYVLADADAENLNRAGQRLENYDFVDFVPFDPRKEPAAQDFSDSDFDIVICSQGLGVEKHVKKIIKNIGKIIAPDGVLISVEKVGHPLWKNLVFGLFRSWWNDREEPQPLTANSGITGDFLRDAGFTGVQSLTGAGMDASSQIGIVAARAPSRRLFNDGLKIADAASSRTFFVVTDSPDGARPLLDKMEENGVEPVLISQAEDFEQVSETEIRIDLRDRDKLESFVDQYRSMESGIISFVLLIKPVENEVDSYSGSAITESLSGSCLQLMTLVQAVMSKPWTIPVELSILTGGLFAPGTEAPIRPEYAALWGMGRTIRNELGSLRTRLIDFTADTGDGAMDSLFSELVSDGADDEITLRGQKRYINKLARISNLVSDSENGSDFIISQTKTRGFEGLKLLPQVRRKPGPGEVEIRVRAASINFKDIARISGLLDNSKLEDSPTFSNLGLDCAGVVERVGPGVRHIKPGDSVFGLVSLAFSTYTTVRSEGLVTMPEKLSYEAASTIPIAYLTAFYSLRELAKIRKGEYVLIHTATGGMGLAAIEVARLAGAKILATAGTPEKRFFLKSLGLDYVGDSRSLKFHDEISALFGDRPVDVVINTLTGKAIEKSVSLLKPASGRFIDLSNFYGKEKLSFDLLSEGISLYTFDIETLGRVRPELILKIMTDIRDEVEKNGLHPLVHRVFSMSRIKDALNYIRKGRHMGKAVLSNQEPGRFPVFPDGRLPVKKNGTYLITGGYGGFGLSLARSLVEQGVRHLVLIGRRGAVSREAREFVRSAGKRGVELLQLKADVCREEDVARVFKQMDTRMPPLKGVIHGAGIFDDSALMKMTPEQVVRVMAPKVAGIWNLHRFTAGKKLDFFLGLSSMASIVGNSEQANYSAANMFIDAAIAYRRQKGMAGITVNWGPIGGAGYVADNKIVQELFDREGVTMIPLEETVNILSYLFDKNLAQASVVLINWGVYRKYSIAVNGSPRFSVLTRSARAGMASGAEESGSGAGQQALPEDDAERQEYLEGILTDIVAGILGLDPANLKPQQPFDSLGFDSLMAVELTERIEKLADFTLPRMTLLQPGLNVSGLVEILDKELMDNPGQTSVQINYNAGGSKQGAVTSVSGTSAEKKDSRKSLIFIPRENRTASMRLFCFSYMGGNSSSFAPWNGFFPADIEVCFVELPGHGELAEEKTEDKLDALIERIVTGMKAYSDKPFAVYGHSYGANLGQIAVQELQSRYGIAALHLFVGGAVVPGTDSEIIRMINSTADKGRDEDAISLLKKLMTPDEYLNSKRWLADILPSVKSDMKIIAAMRKYPWKPVSCPITCFAGRDDQVYPPGQYAPPWGKQTTAAFESDIVEGGHLFIPEGRNRRYLPERISAIMKMSLNGGVVDLDSLSEQEIESALIAFSKQR